ncbi:Tropinone reductase-like [Arachis hypogaea]|nr:Tropinone reductase-like [Arachis hypogaea]
MVSVKKPNQTAPRTPLVRTAPAGVTAAAPWRRAEKREVRAEEGEGGEGRAVAAVPAPPPFGLSTSCCQNRAWRKPSQGEASRHCRCLGRLRRRQFPSLPPSMMSPVAADLCSISPLPYGTGFVIAERLGLEGASVVISSRKQQNVEEAAKKLRAKGIEVLALVCHVSNDQQRKDLIQKIAQCRNIYVIVSTAAANPSVDPILQTKDSVLDKLHLPCKALAAEMAPNTRMFHSKSLRQDSTSRELLLLQKLEEVGNSVKVEKSAEMVTTCYLEGSRIF